MAKKNQKNELKKSSTNAIISAIMEFICLIVCIIIPFVVEVEEKDTTTLFIVVGIVILVLIGLIYCSYCAIYKANDKNAHMSKVEEEYNRILEMQTRQPKRRITSKELEERLEREAIERRERNKKYTE